MNRKKKHGSKKVNHKLRARRKAMFWSIRAAAAVIGVTPQTYCRWEQRLQAPQPGSLSLLCEAFGVSDPKELGF